VNPKKECSAQLQNNLSEVKLHQGFAIQEGWPTPVHFAFLLALLIFVSFPAVILGTRTFVFRDYGLFSYPVAFFQRQCFWQGELPLWNPLNYCGVPFLAQWNTMVLYPASLIYLLLPMPWSLSFFCLAHLFWGGLGMYFLAGQWTNHRLAAALGGVVFSFNGLMMDFLMWPSHIATFSWLPWVVWLVPQGWRLGGKMLLWGSLTAVMQLLAGAPETIFLTWVILVTLGCGDWVWLREVRKRLPLRFLGMALLVTLICAAQLLPFLELLANSQRDRGYSSASHDWSIPFWGWANFLVPLFRTTSTHQGVFLQNGQYWTSSYYAGVGTILLVAVAVWRVRDGRVRLLAGLGFFALLLAWGDATELYRILRFFFPGLGFVRYPVKFVILVVAVAPLLAAVGLQNLATNYSRLRRFELICLAVLLGLIAIIIVIDWSVSVPANDWRARLQNGLFRAGFLALVFIMIACFLRSGGGVRILCGCLLLTVFWLDLVTQVPTQNPTASGSVYTPGWARQQLHWSLQPRLGESRVMASAAARETLRRSWLPSVEQNYLRNRLAVEVDCNLLDDVPHVDGFFSLVPRETYRITELVCGGKNPAPEGLLDFLGVSEITEPGTLTGWMPRRTFMPIATAGQQPVFVDGERTLSALQTTNVDLRQTVFLPLEARAKIEETQGSATTLSNLVVANKSISFDVESSSSTIVVLSQPFYPAWKAYVDDKQVRLWRANYAFQAVTASGGKHRVCVVYRDRRFRAGLVCSFLGVAAWFAMWLRLRPRNS
jgi:hypothetical protein